MGLNDPHPINKKRIDQVRKEREYEKLRPKITLTSRHDGIENETGKLVDASVDELFEIIFNDDQDVMNEVKILILNELYYRYKKNML